MLKQTFKKTMTALSLSLLLGFSHFADAKMVEDIQGNKVEIADNIERVAGLWHANNQIILLLGGADNLVATTTVIHNNPWFAKVYPRIKEVAPLTNGQTVQLEELLSKAPQVALLSNAKMLEEVNKAGIKGVLVNFQNFEGLKQSVRITAEVLGGKAPEIARGYIQELEQNIQFVKERLSGIKEEAKPLVLHIANANNLYKIDGGKSMIGEWITQSGGRNALPDQENLVEVSMEEIIKSNPDIIIIGSNNAKSGVDKIFADPAWQSINAVKNQQVYVNPTGVFPWDRYSAEEALQILWAAQKFHPEQFKDVDMVEKTQAFYKKYYHYSLSPENALQILKGLPPLE